MVKFEFTMQDADAENLTGCIQDRCTRSMLNAAKFLKPKLSDEESNMYEYYMRDVAYFQKLKAIVSNGSSYLPELNKE